MAPRRPVAAALLVACLLSLASCGGGGESGDERATSDGPAPATTPDAASAPAPESPTVGTRPATLDAVTVPEAGAAPVGLTIPAIGVDAPVLAVGVEPDGGMEVPSATDVGWYRFGPAPGADGSAVLAAHVDYDGREGVFFRLADLEVGEVVTVVRADGTRTDFVVDETRQVPKADLAGSGVFDRTGPARLALVTCGGEFDEDRRSYRDNVVVLASPAA